MTIRPLVSKDVPAVHVIRLRVRENRLRNPKVVQEADYLTFMARDTMSWVCEVDGVIAGFVMVDAEKQNLWALFVAPEQEGKGIGRTLHDAMFLWYFNRRTALRLTTAPDTRAASFYSKAGYACLGPTDDGKELIFELRK